MTTRLILPGRESETASSSTLLDEVQVETLRAHVVDSATRGTALEPSSTLDGARDSDIVEIEFENGVKQWVSVAQLRKDLAQDTPEAATRGVVVPSAMRSRGAAQRGLLSDLLLKGLKVLRISPTTVAAEAGVKIILEKLESKLKPGPGLYRFPNPKELRVEDRLDAAPASDDPYLLFIHGTASNSGGAFWRLAGTDEWAELARAYGNRILAFEHRTLSRNPMDNAIELVGKLPKNAKLHIVSHSRGGLVGDLLCLPSTVDAQTLAAPFVKAKRADEAKQVETLVALIQEKQLQVERFVRIACPARGTVLIDKRMDIWMSTLLNLVGFIPGLQENPIYDFVKATVLELVSMRAEPDEVPGVEAQMPDSPFIHLVNTASAQANSLLGVIAGDVQGAGFVGKLKIFATDVFFLEDHDLVVNTDSMYGGLQRDKGKATYFFEQGDEVNHFNYFRNSSSRAQLQKFLLNTAPTPPPAFKELTRGVELGIKRAAPPKGAPVVFLLPGIMGSELNIGDESVWMQFKQLVLGGLARLAITEPNVAPTGLIADSYQQISQYLSASYEVIEFPYDWRQSLQEAGNKLRERIKEVQARHNGPVYLLAHSMGGLVARAMIAYDQEGVWQKLCARNGRLVMLGTPNRGSYVIPQLLAGQEDLVRKLALIDVRNSLEDLIAVVREFPGLLELLPEEFLEPARWKTLNGITPPDVNRLREAKEVRTKISRIVDRERMVYVAGAAQFTPCGLEDDTLTFVARGMGDGRVTYELGRLEGVPTWYMDAIHGDMANHPPAFDAITELLNTGKTDKLATQPTIFRGAEEIQKLPKEAPTLFPTQEDVVAAAVGGTVKRATVKAIHTLQVSVKHTDLRYASYPIAVGHYQGGVIVGPEKAIDYFMGQRLSRLAQVELYPGAVGTVEALLADKTNRPQGALIIGLGEAGELTPEKLRHGVCNAALRYAMAVIEREARPESGEHRVANISSLLIGANGYNPLGVESCVTTIVQGVMQANRVLQAQGLWNQVRIEKLEFIELYEDAAIQAMNAVVELAQLMAKSSKGQDKIVIKPAKLETGESGQFLRPPAPQISKWVRVTVTAKEDQRNPDIGHKNLHFAVQSERARAEETLNATQRSLVDILLRDAINQRRYDEHDDESQLGATLFHLLVPNSLREQTSDQPNIMLILDRESAQYPWELLADRQRSGIHPLVLNKGMIRQLRTADYRPNPQPARELNALVIGDTINPISPLPGAKREAEAVANALTGLYDVKLLVQKEMPPIINALYAKDYRIVHLAGHGEYNEKNPSKSGMVLSHGTYLSTAELTKLTTVPDLVFINCCHLGSLERRVAFGKMAASIADELIKMGVKAIIAAGWAVDDKAALTFAKTFYDRMLHKAPFGDAVRAAREETYNQHPNTNTWGAYQCYGNPEFTLNLGAASGGGGISKRYSQREYRDEILSLTAKIRNASAESKVAYQKQLTSLQKDILQEWLDGQVLSHLGEAWRNLGDFEQAIDCYRQAINDEGARMTLKDVEQLANLEVRQALQRIRDEKKDPAIAQTPGKYTVDKLLEDSQKRLTHLRHLGDTVERLSLLGSFHKKLAEIGRETNNNMKLAKEYYDLAYLQAQQINHPDAFYPALNWAVCYFLSGGGGAKAQEQLRQRVEVIQKAAKHPKDFWGRVAGPDAELIQTLMAPKLPGSQEEKKLIALYKEAFASGATEAEKKSVLDQFDFMITMLQPKKGKWLKIVATLQHVQRELAAS